MSTPEEDSSKSDELQNIARSAFADMLHDTERNELYGKGVEWAIKEFRKRGVKEIVVLDIGTGSGILSMLALRHGADVVYACDSFTPAIEAAKKVTADNGFEGKIKFIPKASQKVTVGANGDMATRAHILVTELFDTELIGEGAINTYDDAKKRLLHENCIMVPQTARVHVQLASSELLRRHHTLGGRLDLPEELKNCLGTAAVHDLQMSQLVPGEDLMILTNPLVAFNFDFREVRSTPRIKHIKLDDFFWLATLASTGDSTPTIKSLPFLCVLMWWDCTMCPGTVLSCAPYWAHPDGVQQAWRDHWMQAVYYPFSTRGSFLSCYRDEYSFWFNVQRHSEEQSPQPFCTCGVHFGASRLRIAQLGDIEYLNILADILQMKSAQRILIVGDCLLSLPAFLAMAMPQRTFHFLDPNGRCCEITKSIIQHNSIKNCEEYDQSKEYDFDLIFCEPQLSDPARLSDHQIFLNEILSREVFRGVPSFPSKVFMWAVWVDFDHLWKIRAPIGETIGFRMTEYDAFIQEAMSKCDSNVEYHPLWEYPCIAKTEPVLLSTGFTANRTAVIRKTKPANALVLWCDYDENLFFGPQTEIIIGERIQWNRYVKHSVVLCGSEATEVSVKIDC